MRILIILLVLAAIFTVWALVHTMTTRIVMPTIEIMGLSTFDSREDIGAAVFKRFWQEINEEKLIVLGSTKQLREYEKLGKGFLSEAKKYNVHFEQVYEDGSLNSIFVDAEASKMTIAHANPVTSQSASSATRRHSNAELRKINWGEIQGQISKGEHVLVHADISLAANEQLMKVEHKGLMIFSVLMPTTAEEKKWYSEICEGVSTTHFIECGVLKFLTPDKSILKKNKLVAGRNSAIIQKASEEYLDKKYYLMVHEAVGLGRN
ncbi:MAG: hypothetical protein ABL927_00480 [Bdellovibrionales bacterium]